jgi:hypothetical protein
MFTQRFVLAHAHHANLAGFATSMQTLMVCLCTPRRAL